MFRVRLRSLQRIAHDVVGRERGLRGGSDPGVIVVVRRVAVQGPATGQGRGVGRVAQLGLRHGQHADVDGKGHEGDDGDHRHHEEHEHRAAAARARPLFCRGRAGRLVRRRNDCLDEFERLADCMVSLPRFDARW